MAKFSAIVLGLAWLSLSFLLLLGGGFLVSLFILPCTIGGVNCSTLVTNDLLLNTFPTEDMIRALQALTVMVVLFGITALIGAATMLSYGFFRRQQHAAALGIGFSLFVAVFAALSLEGIGRAKTWNTWVRAGCNYAFSLDGGSEMVTLYLCAAYAEDCQVPQLGPTLESLLEVSTNSDTVMPSTSDICTAVSRLSCRLPDNVYQALPAGENGSRVCTDSENNLLNANRTPYVYLVDRYDILLDAAWIYLVALLGIGVLFTPWLLSASATPPAALRRRFRNRADVCVECGRMGQHGEVPSCVLCQIPYTLHATTPYDVNDYPKPINVELNFQVTDAQNEAVPMRRMQLQVNMPTGFEYEPVDLAAWTVNMRRGRQLRLNSPSAFLPVVREGGTEVAHSAAKIALRVKPRILWQLRRTQRYPIKLTVVPQDGLTRKPKIVTLWINIRRRAWFLGRGE